MLKRSIRFRNRQVDLSKEKYHYVLRIGLNWFTYGLDDTQCARALESNAELLNLVKDFSLMYF